MNGTLGRRRFLSGAVLGSATVVSADALGGLPARPSGHAGNRLPPGTPDPNFAEGKVIGIHDSRVTVASREMLIHRVDVDDATDIWKLRHGMSLDDVEVGDVLYARGVAGPGGLFVADAVWVNIVNLHALVTRAEPDQVHLDHAGGHLVGRIVPDTTVVFDRLARPDARVSRLRVGSHAQVVGAWRPDTNEIDIATILT